MVQIRACDDMETHDPHEWIHGPSGLRKECPGFVADEPEELEIPEEPEENQQGNPFRPANCPHKPGEHCNCIYTDPRAVRAVEFARRFHEHVEQAYEANPAEGYEIWSWDDIPQPHKVNMIQAAWAFLEEK